jgi:hypothetical protein
MKKILSIVLCTMLLVNCAMKKGTQSQRSLEQFANTLIGNYSSKAQSIQDTSYFHISLVMTRVWPERTDGIWLYVEQAMASNLAKPYRQRVYKLSQISSNAFRSDIYMIKDALSFAGLRDDGTKRSNLTFEKIDLKDGCEVILTKKGNMYSGGTIADHCPSDLKGAKYATTKIKLKKGELISWDQGFNANGEQVWGATKGGYIFVKE